MRRPVAIVTFLGFWLSACDDGAAECNTASDCATGSICVESQCTVVCTSNSHCPGDQYCIEGTCSAVECVPGARCDDRNPCTEDDECDVVGICVGLPVVCDQIPIPECVDADTRRIYSAGSCQGGECVYPYTNAACPDCPCPLGQEDTDHDGVEDAGETWTGSCADDGECVRCSPDCAGRCGGPDGCGGICPDTCVAPDSCGGGDTADVCGCTPDCAGRCDSPDGCGGTCAATCPDGQICGAVTPNECGCCAGWWHCSYAGRTLLQVQAVDELPAGFSIPVVFDHALSVQTGETLSSGDDLRVVFWTGSAWVELDRVLDPESSWGSTSTTIWFPLYRAIAAGDHDDYQIYTTNPSPSPPPADESQVFAFADFFDRAGDLGDGDGWSVTEGADIGAIDIVNGALAFTQTFDDNYYRPLAQHDFPPVK